MVEPRGCYASSRLRAQQTYAQCTLGIHIRQSPSAFPFLTQKSSPPYSINPHNQNSKYRKSRQFGQDSVSNNKGVTNQRNAFILFYARRRIEPQTSWFEARRATTLKPVEPGTSSADRWVLTKATTKLPLRPTTQLPRVLRTYEKHGKSGNRPAGTKKGLLTTNSAPEALEKLGSGGWI